MKGDGNIKISVNNFFLFIFLIVCILTVKVITDREKISSEYKKVIEKAKDENLKHLKSFSQDDLKKIVILTEGRYSKVYAVCLFEITQKNIIEEFKVIISRQNPLLNKETTGQHGRFFHITLFNKKNEKYSFSLDGEPYSGMRPINQVDIAFFKNPFFDVSYNFIPEPSESIKRNINRYGLIGVNLQNYELYYFLKKYIIDFTEENRKNTKDITSTCYITKYFKK